MALMDELDSLYGKRIAVLGLAFKADSDDTRLSPSLKLVEILKAYGAEVLVHDPHIKNTLPLEDVLQNPEAVILATNHSAFKKIAATIDESGCRIVFDVWGIFKPNDFTRAGYRRFGRAR
jgi:UDP-N-acetyl-D-mannosaminuronic acid dehydrogenase